MGRNYGLPGLLLATLAACSTEPVLKEATPASHTPTASSYALKSLPIPIEILEARVDFVPPMVLVRGKNQLTWELNLANSFRHTMVIRSIEIVDPKQADRVLHSFDSAYLEEHFQRPGLRGEDSLLEIGANQYGVAYLRMNFAVDRVPEEFFHRLTLEVLVPNAEPRPLTLELARTTVPYKSKLVLSPPVRSGIWLYESDSHWVGRELTEGRPSSAQRFAIDLVKLGDKGQLYNDGQGPNSKYVTYGEPLLAVADGEVIAVKDGIVENDPETGEMAVEGTRRTITGNYIMLDIGDDVVAVYGHLQPASLNVKVGDRVRKNDVIGLLGNSGNSDLPHLHFHLETRTDRNLTLSGEGVPYHFREFDQAATFTVNELQDVYTKGRVDVDTFHTEKRVEEFPSGNGVIVFN